MKFLILGFISFYQKFISKLLGRNCRFYPTCSHYTYQAIKDHGTIIGLYLGIKRILKCHPFHEGGWDPVPPKKKNSKGDLN